jgi:RNA polymerase sigma-70 factor (ECF subfamily)
MPIASPEPRAEEAPGAQGALEALHPASFGWALGCCGFDREEAADVLQAAYLKVLDGQARFDGRSSFKTWLFSVIRRTASERRRRGWVRRLALARWHAAEPRPEPAPGPEALTRRAESVRALRQALGALPRRQREVLHLVFHEDLSVEDAAAVMGVSLGSARRHYHRGKVRLRALLKGDRP